MRRFCSVLAAGIAMVSFIGLAQQASTPGPYKVLKTAKTGGLGGFDYIYADASHLNTLAADAIPIARSGDVQVLGIP